MNRAERNMHPYSKVHQLRVYICAGWKKGKVVISTLRLMQRWIQVELSFLHIRSD